MWEDGQEPPVIGLPYTAHGNYVPLPIVSLTRKPRRSFGRWWEARVWCGAYGSRGDNLFCHTECGYRWAARRLSMDRA